MILVMLGVFNFTRRGCFSCAGLAAAFLQVVSEELGPERSASHGFAHRMACQNADPIAFGELFVHKLLQELSITTNLHPMQVPTCRRVKGNHLAVMLPRPAASMKS